MDALRAALVRWFTPPVDTPLGRLRLTHVGVVVVANGRVMVLEAVKSGVHIAPLSDKPAFFWVPMSACWTDKANAYAWSLLGQTYSYWQAAQGQALIWWTRWRRLLGDSVQRDDVLPPDDARWQCAELAIRVLRKAGIEIGGPEPMATPNAVVSAALARGKLICLVQT